MRFGFANQHDSIKNSDIWRDDISYALKVTELPLVVLQFLLAFGVNSPPLKTTKTRVSYLKFDIALS